MRLSVVPPEDGRPAVSRAYSVELDGVKVFPAGLQLDMREPQQLPTVTVDVPVFPAGRIDLDDPLVLIPDSTRDLLVRLGWTPPTTH